MSHEARHGAPAMVAGPHVLSKRLNLRARVRWIEWTATGSEFESLLVLYDASRAAFGAEEARRRLRLHPPAMLRVTMEHAHPRVYATNRLSRRTLHDTLGPFPSRAAAERYCDAVLDLFKLRRCHEDLQVHPEHPGCAYGEMKKCMEPCKAACSAEEYAREAEAVRAFFATRGESTLGEIASQREAASEAMDFERAAELHKQWEKVKAAAALADELVRPVTELRAVVVQKSGSASQQVSESAGREKGALERGMEAAVFLFAHGRICGPERLSTLGVRAVREQTAVGSSLFAQPLMLAAVPLDDEGKDSTAPASELAGDPGSGVQGSGGTVGEGLAEDEASASERESTSVIQLCGHPVVRSGETGELAVAQVALSPEERARAVMARLEERVREAGEPDVAERGDFLALFRRWYYRPAKQRVGEVFLPNADGGWPLRRILNGAARVVLGTPREMAAVDREAAREKYAGMKTKVIHAGREGVERVVPVLPKKPRKNDA